MKFTTFLRLKKPESTDYVQVEDLNENMDILDSEMEELSNKSENHTHTKSQITDFPTSMTPTAHNQSASTITAGTFAGQVVANSGGQAVGTSLLRNSKLVSAETNPTVNGEICWTYE